MRNRLEKKASAIEVLLQREQLLDEYCGALFNEHVEQNFFELVSNEHQTQEIQRSQILGDGENSFRN